MRSIAIIADSTCDLSKELLERYRIKTFPLHIHLGEEEYLDGVNISPEELYQWSDANRATPKTSTVSPGEAQEVLREALDRADEVICFCISEDMSACAQVMRLAVQELEAEDRVHIVNSASLSTGIGLQIVEAAVMAEQGVPAKVIVDKIQDLQPYVRASFVVDTLTYLHRGGRCIVPVLPFYFATASFLFRLLRLVILQIFIIIKMQDKCAELFQGIRVCILCYHIFAGAKLAGYLIRDWLGEMCGVSVIVQITNPLFFILKIMNVYILILSEKFCDICHTINFCICVSRSKTAVPVKYAVGREENVEFRVRHCFYIWCNAGFQIFLQVFQGISVRRCLSGGGRIISQHMLRVVGHVLPVPVHLVYRSILLSEKTL